MKILKIFLLPLFLLLSSFLNGQDLGSQLSDGAKIEYTYTDGGAVILTFYNDLLRFEWVAGPNAGAKGADFPFRTHQIAEDIILVNWQMPDEKNFVTLTFNFQSKKMYGSTIMGYGTDQEFLIFDEAVITNVEL
jgi:hypothetical protein